MRVLFPCINTLESVKGCKRRTRFSARFGQKCRKKTEHPDRMRIAFAAVSADNRRLR